MHETGEIVGVRRITEGWVPAGGDALLPRAYAATITDSADYPGLAIELVVDVDNYARTTCRELHIRTVDDTAITPNTIRSVRLAELLRVSARAAMEKVERDTEGQLVRASMTGKDLADFHARFTGARAPRQGSPLTDDQLRKVAELYRGAQSQGLKPVKTIQAAMNISRPTASRWVAAARKRGFLEERKGKQ